MAPKGDKPDHGQGRGKREEAHARRDEREANKTFLYDDGTGNVQEVRVSKEIVMVYPADGMDSAATVFAVEAASLQENDEDDDGEEI